VGVIRCPGIRKSFIDLPTPPILRTPAHHNVSGCHKLFISLVFLSEDVAGVAFAIDPPDVNLAMHLGFTHTPLSNVAVSKLLGDFATLGPINTSLVVIEKGGGNVRSANVKLFFFQVSNMLCPFRSFVHSFDFSLTGGTTDPSFTLQTPSNQPSLAHG